MVHLFIARIPVGIVCTKKGILRFLSELQYKCHLPLFFDCPLFQILRNSSVVSPTNARIILNVQKTTTRSTTMFRVDSVNFDDSLDGLRRLSTETSECSGLSPDSASVTLSTNSGFTKYGNGNSVSSRKSIYSRPSIIDCKSPKISTSSSVLSTRLTRRPSIAIRSQCSSRDIPECVIASECYDDSNSTTMTASYDDEILRYSNECDHLYEELSSPALSYSPNNWKCTVALSSNIADAQAQACIKNSDNSDALILSTTTTVHGRRVCHKSGCTGSLRRSGVITKASARILELPRDVAFDSSCDSSVDEENDDHHCLHAECREEFPCLE